MDRIQEAIAKARAERQGKIGRAVSGQRRDEEGAALELESDVISPAAMPADWIGSDQHERSVDGAGAALSSGDRLTEAAASSAPEMPNQEPVLVGWPQNVPPPVASAPEALLIDYTRTRRVELDEAVLQENRVIAGFEQDQRVEPYRQLRTQLLQRFRENDWNTLAITSAHEHAGKSLTAVNLAISISREVNQTVLLVDLDLRQPSVHRALGIEVEYGIVDALQGDAALEDVLINPMYPRLVVLPGRALGRFSSEILSSPAMTGLLNEIRSRYDQRFIIFDLPPLLRNDDALLFAPMVDATLLVIECGITTEEEISRSMQLLKNGNLIGSILNKFR